jgi:hypothetical protein
LPAKTREYSQWKKDAIKILISDEGVLFGWTSSFSNMEKWGSLLVKLLMHPGAYTRWKG